MHDTEYENRPSPAIELAEFLIGQPSLEELAAFRVSDQVQHYLDYLLDRNGEDELTRNEHSDLHQVVI